MGILCMFKESSPVSQCKTHQAASVSLSNYSPSQAAELLLWSMCTREKESSFTYCVFPALLAPVCTPWGQIFLI